MKKFFSFAMLFSIVGMNCIFAQGTEPVITANLNHAGTIRTFEGATALASAHSAAVVGDVITLSAGTFNATTISKNVTVRGAGYDNTIISGANSITSPATLEGLKFDTKLTPSISSGNSDDVQLKFIKCYFYNGISNGSWNSGMILFYNCLINYTSYLGLNCTSTSKVVCLNSYIWYPYVSDNQTSLSCVNCIVRFYDKSGQNPSDMKYAKFENCIMSGNSSYPFPSTVTAIKNLATSQLFTNIDESNGNMVESTLSNIFASGGFGTGELTENGKSIFLGTDGKEVGIHGGMLPWNQQSSVPQITSFKVDWKVNKGDKLGVDVEVNDGKID